MIATACLVNKFKVNVVFELEKENAFKNTEEMRKKFKEKYDLNFWEVSEVNRLINNYQIKTYGSGLGTSFIDNYKIPRTDSVYRRKVRRK